MDKDLRSKPYADEERWSGIKRTRVGCEPKFHQDSKYRGYRPDFAALARLYPDTFGHLYVLTKELISRIELQFFRNLSNAY
jgi:hypothetical protein